MKKYMLKKPEFMEEMGKAKYMPNPAITLLIALLIFLIYTIVASIVGAVVGIASIRGTMGLIGIQDIQQAMRQLLQSDALVLTLIASEGLLILFAIIHVRYIDKRPVRTMGLLRRRFVLKFLAGAGTAAAIILLSSWTIFILPGSGFKSFTPISIAYLFAFMLVGAGEEALFRGYVLTEMMRRMGVVWSIVLSSAFFALFHAEYSLEGILQVFMLGVLLSLFFLRTGSLWGAIGLHMAWDFLAGLLSPMAFGNYGGVDYSVVRQPDSPDILGSFVTFAVLLISIALLLFAGRNRLVVRKTPERDMYERAFCEAKSVHIGVTSMNGKPYFHYLRRVAEAASGEDAKAAALLKYACLKGLPLASLESKYSPEVFYAVAALAPGENETRQMYEQRASENETAARVIAAENWINYLLGPGWSIPSNIVPAFIPPRQVPLNMPFQQYPPNVPPQQFSPFMPPQQAVPQAPPPYPPDALVECPMLKWSIRPRRCREVAFAVDMDRLEDELDPEVASAAKKDICRQCSNRGR